ncbi:MAG: hypothetical protein JWO89_2554 [Verrucomicrobiaceae bacterium]|nr:hypothetical protein [Verrucomicrobiaceae bacterium]
MKWPLSRLVMLFIGLATVLAHGRTWTEAATGKKIEADYVSSNASNVTLSSGGGKTFDISLARLSVDDQAFVRQQALPAPNVEDRFKDIVKLDAATIPVNGEVNVELKDVDEAIKQFMAEKGIPALTFAISKGGNVIYDRAFGWADSDLKTALKPGVKMRVASMTKPVVSAAVHTLFDNQQLKPSDLVFAVLNLAQYPEAKECDTRWKLVTIQNLLDHKGGWNRAKSGDFTNDSTKMTAKYGVKLNELQPTHVVRYGLTRLMDADPGTAYAYCNFGYILLVRVIEKVSGQKFMDYLQATVAKEAGAPSFSLSSSDARDRQPGETWYCYHPEYPKAEVPLSFRTESRDGAGILACTAADYCRFLETYWISGLSRKPGAKYIYSFAGSHPGVTAICSQRSDGLNYAAIANRRGGGATDWNADLRKAIDAALEPVAGKLK